MSYGRRSLLGLLALVGRAQPVMAQDSMPAQGMGSAELRQRIEERFTERVKLELGLNEEQTAKLKQVAGDWFAKRRAMEGEERDLRQALAGSAPARGGGQLRQREPPGVPARWTSRSGTPRRIARRTRSLVS